MLQSNKEMFQILIYCNKALSVCNILVSLSLYLLSFEDIVWTRRSLFKQLGKQVLEHIAKTYTTNRFSFRKHAVM